MRQRLGVGERFGVLYRPAMYHVAYGQFGDLAGACARDIWDGDDVARHVARRGAASNSRLHGARQFVIEDGVSCHADEQDHPHVIVPVLSDDKGFLDLVECLYLAIDLGGADAHAARVQCGVGPSVDDHPAALGQGRPVTMPPDALEMLEIGSAVFCVARIVPEHDRHRRERLQAA